MNKQTEIPASKIFDVRTIYANRHQQIFDRFQGLAEGDYFVLRNGHDPLPLRAQFEQLLPGCFTWEYLEPGPGFCQVKIGKIRSGQSATVSDCSCGH